MKIDLRWLASESASCFHAAEALLRHGELADAQVAAAISGPLKLLGEEITATDLPEELVWEHLVPQAAGIENNRELAQVVLTKTVGHDIRSQMENSRLAGLFSDLETAFRHAAPKLVDKLALRSGPLRKAWDARGPGLMQAVARLTDERVLVERADVILVHPVLGGAGTAHLPYNSVRIEAVLADSHQRLPEMLRLGWLLSQLNLDVPLFSETVSRHRLARLAQLAMLPVVLTAAEQVELAQYDQQTIRLALDSWKIAVPDQDDLVDVIDRWWKTYTASKPRWNIALASLDQMLQQADLSVVH